MTARADSSELAGSAAIGITPEDVAQAEADVMAMQLAAFRAELPPHLTADDEGNVIPAEGFQPCPLCKGDTVIPIQAPQSPNTMACPSCLGFGQVSTGSRLSETMQTTCEDCAGNGYVKKLDWQATHPEWQNENSGGT